MSIAFRSFSRRFSIAGRDIPFPDSRNLGKTRGIKSLANGYWESVERTNDTFTSSNASNEVIIL
jgi:hypothetical protein